MTKFHLAYSTLIFSFGFLFCFVLFVNQPKHFDLNQLPCYPGQRLFEIRDKDTMTIVCENSANHTNWQETWVKNNTIWTLIKTIEVDPD